MTQSSLLAFAVVGQQAEETREQRQAQQRAREERKKQALELLGLPWPCLLYTSPSPRDS